MIQPMQVNDFWATDRLPADRRLAVMYVSKDLLLSLVLGSGSSDELPRCRIVGMPEGWKAVNISYCWDRDSFAVLIWHPSFVLVGDGMMIPDICPCPQIHLIKPDAVVESGNVKFREFL